MRSPILALAGSMGFAIIQRDLFTFGYTVQQTPSRLSRRQQNLSLSHRNYFLGHKTLSSTKLRLSAVDRTGGFDSTYYYGDEERILKVYEEWRAEYSKGDFDPVRFQNFRENYIKLMTANAAELTVARDMGYPDPVPLSLNEYGDYSPEEFNNFQNNHLANPNSFSSNGYSSQQLHQNNFDDERERIRQVYKDWCYKYGRTYDESRLETFASNLRVVENYYRDTGRKAELNQYADISPEEYEQIAQSQQQNTDTQYNSHLTELSTTRQTPASVLNQYYDEAEVERIRGAYVEWCNVYGKQYDESRLDIFASNLLAVESYRAETGANVKLNANADLSPEEYSSTSQERVDVQMDRPTSQPENESNTGISDYTSYVQDASDLSSGSSNGSSYLESLSETPRSMSEEQIRSIYGDWCVYYNKATSDDGFRNFKNKYTELERLYRENGEEFSLDENSDLAKDDHGQEAVGQAEERHLAEQARQKTEEQRRILAEEERRAEETRQREEENRFLAEEQRRMEEVRQHQEEQRKKQEEEEKLAEEARQQEIEKEKMKKAEEERIELARQREEERKKAEQLLQLEEERKRIEEEVRIQKEKEERAKFEEARKRVEEARLLEQQQATDAAKQTLEQREEAAAQLEAEETALIFENPELVNLTAERKRLQEEKAYLEEALKADKARLNEEKRLESVARLELEETNRLLDENLKEDEDEKPDPIILPRTSYLDAVAKTWVDRTAYLEALQEGRVGVLPTTTNPKQKVVETSVEKESQSRIKQSESLIESIWNFMKEDQKNEKSMNVGYSKSLIRQADKLIDESNKTSSAVIGEELRYLKKAVNAMRRRNNDDRAAEKAILEAKEWEQIQKGLEKEAKEAKKRRDHEERMVKEARQKARSLKTERRQHDKRAEEARREERTLQEEKRSMDSPTKGLFSFFTNPFEISDSGNVLETWAAKKADTGKKDTDRNLPSSKSMTHPVKIEKSDSWLEAVFGLFSREEKPIETPGLGTITLEPAKKASVFDLFVSPDSIEPYREPGRGSITIEDSQEPSIFSFFAKFGVSQKQEKEIDPVRLKRVMDYESKVRTREEKLLRLKAGRARILEEKDKKMSRKEARKLQRELDSLAAGNFTVPPRSSEIPQLAKWTRTPDGRITGWISDPASGQYKMGTKITTSPVKGKIVKPGVTVTTITGSKYRLGLLAEREITDTATINDQNSQTSAKQRLSPMGSILGRLFPEENIPSLVEWNQNEDGTITGFVNNKEGFEDGTQITTSPVEMGARRGMVIETVGGSKYKLMKHK